MSNLTASEKLRIDYLVGDLVQITLLENEKQHYGIVLNITNDNIRYHELTNETELNVPISTVKHLDGWSYIGKIDGETGYHEFRCSIPSMFQPNRHLRVRVFNLDCRYNISINGTFFDTDMEMLADSLKTTYTLFNPLRG